MHPIIEKVTQEVIERSHPTRSAYLKYIDGIAKNGPIRSGMGCGNLAHGFAACSPGEKADLRGNQKRISPLSPPTTICCRHTNLIRMRQI